MTGEGIISWAFVLFKPVSSLSFVFFLVFHGGVFVASSMFGCDECKH
jgi:hypothetical protein